MADAGDAPGRQPCRALTPADQAMPDRAHRCRMRRKVHCAWLGTGRYRNAVLSHGVTLSNRYLLNERIATGGMGDVWRSTDVLLGRAVAVKVLLPSLVSDPEFTTRFHAEARMMAALRHPGIVQVHDFGEAAVADAGRVSYLVMEYVDGEPLLRRIRRAGRLGIAESMSVVAQAAEALHAAHAAGIVHRDVKPGNLLIKPDGTVVLVDFGIARSADMANITATHMVMGTALYMSPEQAGGQRVSAATDIYALGVVTYCCLTGHPPFTGDNPVQVALQHLQEEPPALPAEIPAPVAALVSRALAKNPADRYPSAAQFAAAARAASVAGSAPAARAPQGPAPAGPGIAVQPPAASASVPPASPPAPTPRASPPSPEPVPPAYPPSPAPRGYPPSPSPSPSGARGSRRRKGVLAGVVGAVLVALTGLIAAVVLRPDASHTADQSSKLAQDSTMSAQPSAPGTAPQAEVSEAAIGNQPQPIRRSGASGKLAPPASANTTLAAGPATTSKPAPTTSTTKATMPNPYTPVQVCGSGYQVIDSASLTATDGTRKGTVYLLYNSSNGYNCAVTLKESSVGTPTTVTAYLEVEGSSRVRDNGVYSYYAGPVRASANRLCVKWGGSAGGASYGSNFEHCG